MMAGYGRERAEDYIGCKISLISNADIRYEGTLSAISQQDSTVSLENVRSYGTENRRPGAFIPPQDNVYEYIIFRGADIKDLVVYELPVVSALRSSVDSDPAVLEIAALAGQNEASHTGPSQGSGSQNLNGKPVSVQNLMNSQQSGQQRGGGQQRYFPGGNRGGNSNGSSIVYSSRGGNWNRGYNRGGYTGGQGYRQGFNNGMQSRNRFDIEEARKADFDVEAANEEFRKMEISKGDETDNSTTQSGNKSEGGSQQTEAKPGYNPDQFFDNISCDAIEKEQQNKQREQMNSMGMNNQWQDLRQKERQHNAETFGITSRTFNRGGRGGRGGFRGGYQSQSQNGGGGWGNNGGQNQNGGGWGNSGGMNRGGRGGQRGYNGGGGGGGMGRGMGRQQQNQGVYSY
ncbi:hypothetical protein RvY_07849-2 [Ramazzottius varieornatus]|uniref:Uncharacterized protein n=1 Tax=Ramazzottius varieornatus TaxID=947166 RepID=A0A1D1V9N6_RAMVA|nr:hypothetical protein RvY_07849-2 [Ramazzottius varieornatus]